jgi:hypothetical protein
VPNQRPGGREQPDQKIKASPAGGLRPPAGPATTPRSPGNRLTLPIGLAHTSPRKRSW